MSLPTKKARGNAVHFKNSHCLLQQSSNSGAPCTLLDPDSVPEGYAVIQHDFGCRLLKNLPVENPTCCLKYYVSVQQRTPPPPQRCRTVLDHTFCGCIQMKVVAGALTLFQPPSCARHRLWLCMAMHHNYSCVQHRRWLDETRSLRCGVRAAGPGTREHQRKHEADGGWQGLLHSIPSCAVCG